MWQAAWFDNRVRGDKVEEIRIETIRACEQMYLTLVKGDRGPGDSAWG